MIRYCLGLTAACVLTAAAPASAQEYLELSGGFGSYQLVVYAGGGMDASRLATTCVGMVSDVGQLSFEYDGYGGPLVIHGWGDEDISLAVQAPDGRWYCNDDTDGLNPRVNWNSAQNGYYSVYVGAVSSSAQGLPVTISISE